MMTLDDRVQFTPPRQHWSAFQAMHDRLVLWGQIMLRGVMSPDGPSGVPSGERNAMLKAVVWTGSQQAAAMELHSRVIRLPEVRQRIVLQIFYRAWEAEFWHELEPDDQSKIEAEMCREGLFRMRRYNAENAGSLVLILRQSEFRTVREAAVWELLRGEE